MGLRNRERDTTQFTTKDGSTIREYLHVGAEPGRGVSARRSVDTTPLPREKRGDLSHHRGGGELEVDGETRAVGTGDAILIAPGSWHQLTAGGDGVTLLCCCVPPYSDDDTYFA